MTTLDFEFRECLECGHNFVKATMKSLNSFTEFPNFHFLNNCPICISSNTENSNNTSLTYPAKDEPR